MPEPTVLLAASLLATLSTAAAVLVAAVLGAVVAALVARRDRGPAGHPALGDGSVAGELRAIGAQIEQSLAEQRHQGETQRQLLTQKIEGVRETVDAQAHEVDGLRNELRHEARRRDAELDEIRHQIATIRTGEALPAPAAAALPPHAPTDEADAVVDDESDDPVVQEAEASFVEAPYDVALEGDGGVGDADVLDADYLDLSEADAPTDVEADPFGLDAEEAVQAEPAPEDAAPAETVGPFSFEDLDAAALRARTGEADAEGGVESEADAPDADAAEPVAEGGVVGVPASTFDIFTPISFGPPTSDALPAPPAGAAAWVARTDRADAPSAALDADGLVESAFAAPDGAPGLPEDAEDLTVISSIDEATQTVLHGSGVLTLDDVARIGRGDAQRLGLETGVSEHTIMNQWVFEAQAAVFNRFAQETQS